MKILQKPTAVGDASGVIAVGPVSLSGGGPPRAGAPAVGGTDLGPVVSGTEIQAARGEPRRGHDPFARARRAIDRLRGADGDSAEASPDDSGELKLELLLLREENARLKAEHHRPRDLGALIDYLRCVGKARVAPETHDDAWSMLCECLTVREALAQARIENEMAIASVQARLRKLSSAHDDIAPIGKAGADANSVDCVAARADRLVSAA